MITECSNHRKFVPNIRIVKTITTFRHPLEKAMNSLDRKYEKTNPKATLARARLLKLFEKKHKKFLNLT